MKTAIFDIDGTLSNCSARLCHILDGQPDWDAFHAECHLDNANQPVVDVLRHLYHEGGWTIVLCTGRPWRYSEKTRRWMEVKGIPYHNLMMREDDDKQSDVDLKRRMLKGLRDLGHDVKMVFEDRQRVVDMWREEGVFCFQVGKGDY